MPPRRPWQPAIQANAKNTISLLQNNDFLFHDYWQSVKNKAFLMILQECLAEKSVILAVLLWNTVKNDSKNRRKNWIV